MGRWMAYVGLLAAFIVILVPSRAEAYLDPATTGTLYQMGYYVFYATVAFFVFCFRHIKLFFLMLRNRLFPPRS